MTGGTRGGACAIVGHAYSSVLWVGVVLNLRAYAHAHTASDIHAHTRTRTHLPVYARLFCLYCRISLHFFPPKSFGDNAEVIPAQQPMITPHPRFWNFKITLLGENLDPVLVRPMGAGWPLATAIAGQQTISLTRAGRQCRGLDPHNSRTGRRTDARVAPNESSRNFQRRRAHHTPCLLNRFRGMRAEANSLTRAAMEAYCSTASFPLCASPRRKNVIPNHIAQTNLSFYWLLICNSNMIGFSWPPKKICPQTRAFASVPGCCMLDFYLHFLRTTACVGSLRLGPASMQPVHWRAYKF